MPLRQLSTLTTVWVSARSVDPHVKQWLMRRRAAIMGGYCTV